MKRLKVERFGHRLHRSARRALGLDRTVYVEQRLGEYRGYWEAAASRLGAQFHTITDGIWEISRNGASVRLAGHVAPVDDPVTLRLAGDKELGYRMAESVGVPVPAHVVVTLSELTKARTFLTERGGPLVVKPQRGTSSGVGITTHIGTWRGLRRAIILASLFDERIIVEQMVPAESCRLLFLDGEL